MNDPSKLPDFIHAVDLRYVAAMAGVAIWIGMRDSDKEPAWRRIAKLTASALLGVGGGEEVAGYIGSSELGAGVLLMAFGIMILDGVAALLNNKALVTSIVQRWIGGGNDDDRS